MIRGGLFAARHRPGVPRCGTATVPDLGRPQATYLEFGAVNHETTLSVDGTSIGTNTTNPVAVADIDYWNANHQSDTQGTWPVSIEAVSRGAQLSRKLVVFNDTFSGTGVDMVWEMHQDTASGTISSQGTQRLDIPLGPQTTATISVTAPQSGTNAVLVLQSSKNGQIIFRDDAETFKLQ